jgi:hypothetical protein
MGRSLTVPICSEFCFPRLDTHVRVEVSDESVTIRATRDTFSSVRKDFFVRELAAEGFIPDQYRWSSQAEFGLPYGRVRWLVDYEWLAISEEIVAKSRRFALRLFAVALALNILLLELGLAGRLGYTDPRTGVGQQAAVQMRHASAPSLGTVGTLRNRGIPGSKTSSP